MNKPVRIDDSWRRRLAGEFAKPYFAGLREFVRGEYAAQNVFPPSARIFRAFDECPFDHVKVVILGQDPYHGAGQANGLCFGVESGVAPPPSLQNIFKEIEADLGHPVSRDPDLSRWARQGVLFQHERNFFTQVADQRRQRHTHRNDDKQNLLEFWINNMLRFCEREENEGELSAL